MVKGQNKSQKKGEKSWTQDRQGYEHTLDKHKQRVHWECDENDYMGYLVYSHEIAVSNALR